LRSDATRTGVMTLASTADILPSSTQVRDGRFADLALDGGVVGIGA
jgi:hypothetical protein